MSAQTAVSLGFAEVIEIVHNCCRIIYYQLMFFINPTFLVPELSFLTLYYITLITDHPVTLIYINL